MYLKSLFEISSDDEVSPSGLVDSMLEGITSFHNASTSETTITATATMAMSEIIIAFLLFKDFAAEPEEFACL